MLKPKRFNFKLGLLWAYFTLRADLGYQLWLGSYKLFSSPKTKGKVALFTAKIKILKVWRHILVLTLAIPKSICLRQGFTSI